LSDGGNTVPPLNETTRSFEMNRYIVASHNACAVFFDEKAASPLDAIQIGELGIASEPTNMERCHRKDLDTVYHVYLAPPGFPEVTADDYGIVVETCEYVASFKNAHVEAALDREMEPV
jgi:hypothetical protein